MRMLIRKPKKQTIRKEKTNNPRTVAKKFLKKDFISIPFMIEIDGDTVDKIIAIIYVSVGRNL
jgi:hypothetical protein